MSHDHAEHGKAHGSEAHHEGAKAEDGHSAEAGNQKGVMHMLGKAKTLFRESWLAVLREIHDLTGGGGKKEGHAVPHGAH